MNIKTEQLPKSLIDIIEDEKNIYKGRASITNQNTIPLQIPLNGNTWLKIPNVICVFVDMIGSTTLSARKYPKSTASIYRLFTSTAVRIFNELDTPYIDIKGDGVFAIFNQNQIYRALVAAISFKTFANSEFLPIIKKEGLESGCHVGIDQADVVVKRLGFRRKGDSSDRHNEVWAGKPVNMAAKLASLSKHNELYVSDRYFSNLKDDKALKSCDCSEPEELWKTVDLSNETKFDFDIAHVLESNWCKIHGKEYHKYLLSLDK